MFEQDGSVKLEVLSEYLQKQDPDSIEHAMASELLWFRAFLYAVAEKSFSRGLDSQPLVDMMDGLFCCYDATMNNNEILPDHSRATEEIIREFMKQKSGTDGTSAIGPHNSDAVQIEEILGDGKQKIWLRTQAGRRHYVICIDSSWLVDWHDGDGDSVSDHLDEILEAIAAQCGDRDEEPQDGDDWTAEEGRPWPALDSSMGYTWGAINEG